jgi:hypothetical protein
MMENRNKQVMQFVILAVLLGVLGFSGWRMYRLFSPQPRAAAPPATASANAAKPGAPTPAPRAGQPAAPPAAGGKAPAAAATNPKLPMLPGGEVNGDLFRVYALQPPKNPFLKNEAWFKDTLESIPGYPEMRDEKYFDSMDPEFPDIEETFGPGRTWDSITMKREAATDYTLEGESEDGKYRTSIKLTEDAPDDVELAWTPASGVPITSLDDPNYVRENMGKLSPGAAAAAAADGGGLAVPGGDLPAGLAIPGSGSGGDATSAALTGSEGKGDAIVCTGVNVKGKKTTALMYYNGAPYLVMVGSVLPTHYQVMEIKEDGVVLLELRDGSSKWVPLQVVGPAPAR